MPKNLVIPTASGRAPSRLGLHGADADDRRLRALLDTFFLGGKFDRRAIVATKATCRSTPAITKLIYFGVVIDQAATLDQFWRRSRPGLDDRHIAGAASWRP